MSVLFSVPFRLMSNIVLAFSAAAGHRDNDFRDLSMIFLRSLSWTVAAKRSINSLCPFYWGHNSKAWKKLRGEWKGKNRSGWTCSSFLTLCLLAHICLFWDLLRGKHDYSCTAVPGHIAGGTPLWAGHSLQHRLPTPLPSLLEVHLQLPLWDSTTEEGNLISLCRLSATSIHLVVPQSAPVFYYS